MPATTRTRNCLLRLSAMFCYAFTWSMHVNGRLGFQDHLIVSSRAYQADRTVKTRPQVKHFMCSFLDCQQVICMLRYLLHIQHHEIGDSDQVVSSTFLYCLCKIGRSLSDKAPNADGGRSTSAAATISATACQEDFSQDRWRAPSTT